jgi:hypothetical protein
MLNVVWWIQVECKGCRKWDFWGRDAGRHYATLPIYKVLYVSPPAEPFLTW